MNVALANGISASTNPLTTVLWLPTTILVTVELATVDVAVAKTARPAQAAVKTARPDRAATMANLGRLICGSTFAEHGHLHQLRAPRCAYRSLAMRVLVDPLECGGESSAVSVGTRRYCWGMVQLRVRGFRGSSPA